MEGATDKEATDLLTAKIRERFSAGAMLLLVDIPNGRSSSPDPLEYTPTPVDDWFFGELQKAITEDRRAEAETEEKRREGEDLCP